MNLYGTTKEYSTPGGLLTNQMVVPGTQATPMTPTQAFTMSSRQAVSARSDEPWYTALPKYVAAAPVDIADTLLTILPGLERGDVNDAVYESIGMPGYAEWVRQNQGGVEVVSGVVGALAVGYGAEVAVGKLVGSAWFAATGLGRATAGMTQMVARAEAIAKTEALTAAAAGKALSWSAPANLGYVSARVGAGVGKAAVSELAVVAALHNNSAVWSDDLGVNMLFGGLGLGIGGVVGGIGGKAVLNRFNNDQAMKAAFGQAADPGGYMRFMEETPNGMGAAANLSTLRGPVKSAEFTALMLDIVRADSEQAAKAGTKPAITRSAIHTHEEEVALQTLQTMTRKGLTHTTGTDFNIKATGAGQHIIEASRQDPLVLLGATELGVVRADVSPSAIVQAREAGIDSVLNNPFSTNKERVFAHQQKKETPLFLIGGRWFGATDADELARHKSVTQFKGVAQNSKEIQWEAPSSTKKIIMREDGLINTKFESLDIRDQLSVVDAMNYQLKRLGKGYKITLQKNASWLQIDYAVRHAERGGDVDFLKTAGFADIEEARLASFQLKAKQAVAYHAAGKPLDFKTRLSLNLPIPTAMEMMSDPTGSSFFALLNASKSAKTAQELRAARMKGVQMTDLGADTTLDSRLDGNFFEFNRAKYGEEPGEWLPTLVATHENPVKTGFTRFDLRDAIVEQKALMMRMLIGNRAKPSFVSDVTKAITQNPAFQKVLQLSGLADSQIGGTKSSVGAVASQFLTQQMRFRNSETLLAAQALRRVVNRMTEVHLDEVLSSLAKHTENMSSVSGQKSRVLFNNYASYSPGWDIKRAIPGGQGVVFELKDSARNFARYKELFGRDLQKGDTLLTPSGVEVTLDATGDSARQALEAEYKRLLTEQNRVRAARGLDPIERKDFYVPPPSTKGKIIGFTMDADGRVVPGGTVIASTREQFVQQRDRVMAGLQPGQRFLTQEEVTDFVDLWERAAMDYHNPADFINPQSLARPSGPQMGKLAGPLVNPRAYEEALDFLKHGWEQASTGIVRGVFDSQLKISRIRGAAEAAVQPQGFATKSIWQTFDETLIGISATANPRGVGLLTDKFDRLIDSALQAAWPAGVVGRNYLRDTINMLGSKAKMNLSKVKSFDDLAAELGPHMPFAKVTDYVEYKHGLKAPWKSRQMARAVNRIGSGIVLRWLELPHAIMNMTGIITALPVIAQAKNVPTIGRVGNVGVVDVAKIMSRGFKRQFERGTADWDMMVRNGDTSQDVAELHHQLSLLEGKSSFMKFMTGDPRFANWDKMPKGSKGRSQAMLKFKGLEGMASIIADTSENMSRRWAHFVGLELADHHGIVGMEARHNFARAIANDAIANYDPLNRPEIFQSAFGTMYGLFISYAQNYYERMFRWMEAGDFKSIGKSMAIQASMFGAYGMPGYNQVSALIGGESAKDDRTDLMSGIYERFGPAVGSIVAHGGLKEITTLFGLPPVALYTRGDTNFRHPAMDFAGGAPVLPVGLEVIADLSRGTFEAIAALIDPNNPASGRHAAEILARNMPSRTIRGAITTLATGGQEADGFGNLMAETRDWGETALRMVGLRSERQQWEIEAYFMNKKALAIDSERMGKVREQTRALIRSGEMQKLPMVFQKYLDVGGSPWNYKNWLQKIIKEAQSTRAENQALKMMRSPENRALAQRIEWMSQPE